MILKTNNLTVSFMGLIALRKLSFEAGKGAITGLIGPNGAGKSTFFNVVSRIYDPVHGEVIFNGKNLLQRRRHEVAREGIYRTFQTPQIFPRLTVLENLLLGAHLGFRSGLLSRALRFPRVRDEEALWRSRAMELLERFGISSFSDQTADNLPLVFQRRMEIARGLLHNPSLLMLDEPMAGMNYEEKEDIVQLIRSVHKGGEISLIIIEHDIKVIHKICDHVVVLNFGEKIAEGSPEAISKDKEVIKAYLGEERPAG